jgi:hypothetical protein
MEVSRTSMKVARVTVSATAQGLWLGRHGAASWAEARAVEIACVAVAISVS